MFQHYLRLALRGFVRHKLYSFINLAGLSVALACAILRHWLEHYAHRIPLDPAYFLTAGAVALLIAWATVYANALRLARTNPVRSLRYE